MAVPGTTGTNAMMCGVVFALANNAGMAQILTSTLLTLPLTSLNAAFFSSTASMIPFTLTTFSNTNNQDGTGYALDYRQVPC